MEAGGTWVTELWRQQGRPFEAYVSVANPTEMPLELVVRVTFSTGSGRTQRATVAVGETWGMKVRTLFGSQAGVPTTTMTGLTVTCNGGRVACPVAFSWLASPTCVS